MRYVLYLIGITITTLIVLLFSCSQPPHEKVALAQAALDSAKAVSAAIYARADFTSAQAHYEGALLGIEREKRYFSFLRKYDLVSSELDSAVTLALQAAVKAVAKKERLRIAKERKLAAKKARWRRAAAASQTPKPKPTVALIPSGFSNPTPFLCQQDTKK